ncbi:MAG: hypothetical protein R2771_15760 [Saprospiraceae bacterium]
MEDTDLLGVGSRVNHPAYGPGVIVGIDVAAYNVVFIQHGLKVVGKHYKTWDIIEAIPENEISSFDKIEKSLIKILTKWSDISEVVSLGSKWDGGLLILKPGSDDLQSKEIPIDVFFHKIVMVRDRLRVMEQRVNSSNLNEEEKINLQQYITRIYGSLTTFNVLFKEKDDYFIGEKSS